MTEQTARTIAALIHPNAVAVDTGGNLWAVQIPRSDGSIVVLNDESVGLYANADDFDSGKDGAFIEFDKP
jgi:hypothetical protein